MKVWTRAERAGFRASAARSMSRGSARARPHTVLSRTASATACTASKSPTLAIGNPASMTSTRMRSRALAMRTFSSRVIEAPGLCSPSRKVVSKMISRSFMALLRCPTAGPPGNSTGLWVACVSPRQGRCVESVCPRRAAAETAAQAASDIVGRARRRLVWRSDGLTCFGNIPGGARQHNRLRIRGCAASPYEAAQDMAFEPWMRGPDSPRRSSTSFILYLLLSHSQEPVPAGSPSEPLSGTPPFAWHSFSGTLR